MAGFFDQKQPTVPEPEFPGYDNQYNPFPAVERADDPAKQREAFDKAFCDIETARVRDELSRIWLDEKTRRVCMVKEQRVANSHNVVVMSGAMREVFFNEAPRLFSVYVPLPIWREDLLSGIVWMMEDMLGDPYFRVVLNSYVYRELSELVESGKAAEVLPSIDVPKLLEDMQATEGQALEEMLFPPPPPEPELSAEGEGDAVDGAVVTGDEPGAAASGDAAAGAPEGDLSPEEFEAELERRLAGGGAEAEAAAGESGGAEAEASSAESTEAEGTEPAAAETAPGGAEPEGPPSGNGENPEEAPKKPENPQRDELVKYFKGRFQEGPFGKQVQRSIVRALRKGYEKGRAKLGTVPAHETINGLLDWLQYYYHGSLVLVDQIEGFEFLEEEEKSRILGAMSEFGWLSKGRAILVVGVYPAGLEEVGEDNLAGFVRLPFRLGALSREPGEELDDAGAKQLIADCLGRRSVDQPDGEAPKLEPFTEDAVAAVLEVTDKTVLGVIGACRRLMEVGRDAGFASIDSAFVKANLGDS